MNPELFVLTATLYIHTLATSLSSHRSHAKYIVRPYTIQLLTQAQDDKNKSKIRSSISTTCVPVFQLKRIVLNTHMSLEGVNIVQAAKNCKHIYTDLYNICSTVHLSNARVN